MTINTQTSTARKTGRRKGTDTWNKTCGGIRHNAPPKRQKPLSLKTRQFLSSPSCSSPVDFTSPHLNHSPLRRDTDWQELEGTIRVGLGVFQSPLGFLFRRQTGHLSSPVQSSRVGFEVSGVRSSRVRGGGVGMVVGSARELTSRGLCVRAQGIRTLTHTLTRSVRISECLRPSLVFLPNREACIYKSHSVPSSALACASRTSHFVPHFRLQNTNTNTNTSLQRNCENAGCSSVSLCVCVSPPSCCLLRFLSFFLYLLFCLTFPSTYSLPGTERTCALKASMVPVTCFESTFTGGDVASPGVRTQRNATQQAHPGGGGNDTFRQPPRLVSAFDREACRITYAICALMKRVNKDR